MFKLKALKRNIGNKIAFIIVLILSIWMIFPLYWMVRSSFMDTQELFQYPPLFFPPELIARISNYPAAMTSFTFDRYFVNTMTIEIPVLIGVAITASLSAYAFARLDFPLKNFWFSLVIAGILIPLAVTLIPIFIGYSKLGMYDTYWPMIIPAFLGGGGFNIFLLRQFIMGIPRELDEAATIDGAGHMRILCSILLPMLKPALIVVELFAFMNVWNDLLYPVVFLGTKEKFTMTIGLNQFHSSFGIEWTNMMVASTLMIIPALIIYLFGQKYFIEGIVMTGLKS